MYKKWQKGHYLNEPKRIGNIKIVYLPCLKLKSFETLSHTILSVLHGLIFHWSAKYMVFNPANSFALILPWIFRKKIAINVDGLEWKRDKWNKIGKSYFKLAAWFSTKISNIIVADSKGMANYYKVKWNTNSILIEYGSYIRKSVNLENLKRFNLIKNKFILQITRLEPENNPLLTIQAFKKFKVDSPNSNIKLVIIGDVPYESTYSKAIKKEEREDIIIPGYLYDLNTLTELRNNCLAYVHGNQVGGTNPALLEAMGSYSFIIARSVNFNREVLENGGIYYEKNIESLLDCLNLTINKMVDREKAISFCINKIKLVTGGAGFIGSHLCEELLKENHDVICVDNFYTGEKRNIAHLQKNSKFELIRHDITFPLYVEVERIYNLACPASPDHYQYDPVQTTKTNVHGAINILGMAKRLNARVFQASTSEVYGDPVQHPQKESYWGNVNPIGPRSCYDEGKRCAETLFFDYFRQHNVDIKVGRIFNTYGPNMQPDDGRVISNFIVQAIKGKDITIYGDGHQTRSFCYINDLIIGIIKFMNTKSGLTGPINLGNPSEYSILEVAELIIKITNSKSSIIFKKLPQDDPRKRKPDISLAKKNLDWIPKITLEEGLNRTVHYFKKIIE